ncbi:hypothetical protein HK100_012805 [Physocladia obscura]|uniref:Uncharacterized protein n=1 Tax=Physocladia obscura TaxID=109957 RepID=A0AAD5SZQ6_9FUNG|nr:hypothetical protein HK100_012805 [Physocladia obscura]
MMINGRVTQNSSSNLNNNNSANVKNATIIRTSQVLVRLPANKVAGICQPHVFRVEIPQHATTQTPQPARLLATENHIVSSSMPDTAAIAHKSLRSRAFVTVPADSGRLRSTKRRMGNNNTKNIAVNNKTGFRAVQRQKSVDAGLVSPASTLSFWGTGVSRDLVFATPPTPPVTPLGLKIDTQNISFVNSISFFDTATHPSEPTITTATPIDTFFSRMSTPESQVLSPYDFFSTTPPPLDLFPPASDASHDDAYLVLQDLLFTHDDHTRPEFYDDAVSRNNFNPNIGHLVDGWQTTVSMLLDHQRLCAGI